MFDGFEQTWVDVGDRVELRVRHGGAGTPVVLLHGHPRTHTTWHRVAPLLVAAGHTVVCPDLRAAVTRLAVLDSVPIVEALDRVDARFAMAWWHWFFFAQPDKPEQAILADPDAWYGRDPARLGAEDAPAELAARLIDFLSEPPSGASAIAEPGMAGSARDAHPGPGPARPRRECCRLRRRPRAFRGRAR